jgi:hypothetical protein
MYKSTQADIEATARAIKAINPHTRVFTYHNQEEALERRQQDCLIMYNPENAEWFLRNATGIVNNRKKVNSLAEGCNVIAPPSSYSAEDQYALDFRNGNVSKWWLDEVIGQFTESDVLDGFYWDCPSVTTPFSDNRPDNELAAINAAMSATREVAKGRIAAAGKWSLGMMTPMATPEKCPMACTLSWRPQSQFNCSVYA